jgi:O-antigen ligase
MLTASRSMLHAGLGIMMAFSLHFLLTLDLRGYPVRVALADLVLPLAMAAFLLPASIFRRLTDPRAWLNTGFLVLLAACTAWIAIAIGVGRINSGRWIPWALLQKGAGWGVLLGYLAVGAAMGLTLVDQRVRFLKVFVITAWAVAAISIAVYQAWMVNPEFAFLDRFEGRVEGFFDNPNAYGIAMVAIAGMQLAAMGRGLMANTLLSRWGLAVLVAVIVLARSRSAWIAVPAMLVPLLWLRVIDWQLIWAGVWRGGLLLAVMYGLASLVVLFGGGSLTGTVSISAETLSGPMVDSAVNHRMRIMEAAVAMWRESPVFGIGLGAFYIHELAQGHSATIHTSALWILTEMGLVGLALFAALLGSCLYGLWRAAKAGDSWAGVGLAVLCTLAVSSIGTEILYQRYLWIVLGMTMIRSAIGEREAT